MNQALTESWTFSKRYIKPLFLFYLPFLILQLVIEIGYDSYETTEGGEEKLTLVRMLLEIIIYVSYASGLLIIIDRLAKGESTSFSDTLARSNAIWWPFLGVTLVSGILMLLGFMLLIIPGLWLMIRLLLSQMYVVFEGQPIMQAISSSHHATKPHFWKLVGAIAPPMIASMLIGVAEESINAPALSPITLGFYILNSLVIIYLAVLQYRLYMLYGKSSETTPSPIDSSHTDES